MKPILLLTVCSLCLLTACQSKKEVAPSTASVTAQSTKATRQSRVTNQGDYYTVEGRYGQVIIVNKKHPLSPTYAPGENQEALQAFYQLIAAMQEDGLPVSSAYSGFRSFETQEELYSSYVMRDGQSAADRYSARPGYSEHQTGLAFDVLDDQGALLEDERASQWLIDHAHDYGFIVRYLPDKEAITGYMAESWHIRYLGPEAAAVHASGLTLEEYFKIPGGGYED